MSLLAEEITHLVDYLLGDSSSTERFGEAMRKDKTHTKKLYTDLSHAINKNINHQSLKVSEKKLLDNFKKAINAHLKLSSIDYKELKSYLDEINRDIWNSILEEKTHSSEEYQTEFFARISGFRFKWGEKITQIFFAESFSYHKKVFHSECKKEI